MSRTWSVYHFIHVRTPYQYIPKLVIENVPDEFEERDVKEWLDEMGYSSGMGEFGIPWANHVVEPISEAPAVVRGAYRRGDVPVVEYREPEPVE